MSKRERLFRISCFKTGEPINIRPVVHFAPRTRENANRVFARECKRILGGKHDRVIMHQGNLRGEAYTIVRDQQGWSEADLLTCGLTAFDTFQDLLDAPGGYFPSLRYDGDGPRARLADLYDQAQASRGDSRRAI